jgi:hypothetical protein
MAGPQSRGGSPKSRAIRSQAQLRSARIGPRTQIDKSLFAYFSSEKKNPSFPPQAFNRNNKQDRAVT